MEEYVDGPVTSCFVHISNHPDDVFNNVIKVVLLFGTLALDLLGMLKANSIPWEEGTRLETKETSTETQTEVECPEPVGLAEGLKPQFSWGFNLCYLTFSS